MPTPTPWIHAFVDVPADRVARAHAFWSATTGWSPGSGWAGNPEFSSLVPNSGTPYLHVQEIGGPPRVHLDLVGDTEEDTARLKALGATHEGHGNGWQVMTSPAGLPFCVCDDSSPHHQPGSATWPAGHRSRLVQLCIDVPNGQYDAELTFWRAATGWADEPDSAPEFHRLVHRSESSMQLLLQQLGSNDDASRARAHLDLGTDNRAAEVSRVQRLGARFRWSTSGFTTLQDPLGLPFCVTDNTPDN